MNMNSVLMKFFKLPPAVRMMLALVGFGSLASIIFFVSGGALQSRKAKMTLILVFVAALVVFGLIYLIRRSITGRKSAKLSESLESQGPSRGDIAEQERIYKEKFKSKLADLKSNGLSVYKLPWFILMGEPGCGKTASLIHSGLDFPLGKDEVPGFGGTRNYNWWFTNDAVLLDTAGRIAFHEEGTTDKPEWEFFVKQLRKNRPRCPLNGLIVAIPADKLLRDSPDERANKAAILRERLRQVHQLLGVRFPTFVLVTKMDLVGGFGEFFEEIRVDLQQRNQMFGWSRPGEFQEPYDPANFVASFEEVYQRIRNWSLRYLQRKATEQELGMIVTYPEAFRELRDPLNDYISTIFQKSPLLEPPFFRGFYFTSAVQEGAPILDVFSRTAKSIHVAERPPRAVDSKAFFIHDFYQKKVFAEQGLVFRSARHVTLNKRMRRTVWAGTGAMVAAMLALFAFGYFNVRGLLLNPQADVKLADDEITKAEPAPAETFGERVELAQKLRKHYDAYNQSGAWLYARALYIFASIDTPRRDIQQIHARFVVDRLLEPIVRETGEAFSAFRLEDAGPDARGRYIDALEVYTKWYGEVVGQHGLTRLDELEASQRSKEFGKLLTFLQKPEAERNAAVEQFEFAMITLARQSRSFPREVLLRTADFEPDSAQQQLVAEINKIGRAWQPFTKITANSDDPLVGYWAEFTERLGALRAVYARALETRSGFAGDDAAQAEARTTFVTLTEGVRSLNDETYAPVAGTLTEAYHKFRQFLNDNDVPQTDDKRILRFRDMFARLEKAWNGEFERLHKALQLGAPQESGRAAPVYTALQTNRIELNEALQRSVAQLREKLGIGRDEEPLERFAEANLIGYQESTPTNPLRNQQAYVRLARNALGSGDRLGTYLGDLRDLVQSGGDELKALEDLRQWPKLLATMKAGTPEIGTLTPWFDAVSKEPAATDAAKAKHSQLASHPFWAPPRLYDLADSMWRSQRASNVEGLIGKMAQRARQTTQAPRLVGVARLMPGYDAVDRDLPFKRHRYNTTDAAPRPQPREMKPVERAPREEKSDDDRGQYGRRRRSNRPAPQPDPAPETRQPDGRRPGGSAAPTARRVDAILVRYHTRPFFYDTLRAYHAAAEALKAHPAGEPARAALDEAARTYIRGYFGDWHNLVSNPTELLDEATLALLDQCRGAQLSWPDYVRTLDREGDAIGAALAIRLEAFGRCAVFWAWDLAEGNARDDALFDLIAEELKQLRDQGRSVPDNYRDLFRNAPPASAGDPWLVYARQLDDAWAQYLDKLEALGALDGSSAGRTSGEPPKPRAFREAIEQGRALSVEMPLVAPLSGLTEYGQDLLLHHLDAQLAALFAGNSGRFPLGVGGGEPMGREDLVRLLEAISGFGQRFGGLYEAVRGEGSRPRVFEQARQWSTFLFNSPTARSGARTVPLEVWVEILHPDNTTTAASVYDRLSVNLPLLAAAGSAPVGPIEFGTREIRYANSLTVGSAGAPYRWDLFSNRSFAPTVATVLNRNADADKRYPDTATTWELPGDAWSLLRLLERTGASGEGAVWRIPARFSTSPGAVGFDVVVQIGSGNRSYPGLIQPPGAPGSRPAMAGATKFLEKR